MEKQLPIHERFYSFQGEGVHAGRSAFFIRTYGCPIKCPWCDSAGTWHKDYKPENVKHMSANALLQEVIDSNAEFVVVTGGEPTVHDLTHLTQAVGGFIDIHLETCGAFKIKGFFDWVTLSPKHAKHPTAENVMNADEFKFIIEKPEDIEYWRETITRIAVPKDDFVIWLHPEWTQCKNPEVLNAITEAVKNNPGLYRAGWQMHKCYNADATDKRSQKLAPLGGDPKKGY